MTDTNPIKARISAVRRAVEASAEEAGAPVLTLRVGPAEPADAVAILRAGIREDQAAVAAIVQAVDPVQLCMHLAYLADLFGKEAYGGAEGLDEALAHWQAGGRITDWDASGA